MTNLFGLDLKPLLEKTTEFTQQQAQIITLLQINNQIAAQTLALLKEIQQSLN
jgi:hypothetical protein